MTPREHSENIIAQYETTGRFVDRTDLIHLAIAAFAGLCGFAIGFMSSFG